LYYTLLIYSCTNCIIKKNKNIVEFHAKNVVLLLQNLSTIFFSLSLSRKVEMIPNNSMKRKSSTHATSPPPSRKSPLHAFSPPQTSPPPSQQSNRPLTTAAAAVAAIKRSASSSNVNTPYKRQNTSSVSRQGSVETEREGSVQEDVKPDDAKEGKDKDPEAEAEDDEKEDVIVDMDAHMQAQMEKSKEDMKVLLENFSDEQLQRYEGYRRSALNRTNVKRVSVL
jgi:transcription initiation factor TFIID subunit 11